MNHELNQRISMLAAQLPLQRQQLALQSTTVGQAVRYRLSTPTTLTLAAVSGAVLGWCWFGREPRYVDNGSTANTATATETTVTKKNQAFATNVN